MPPEIENVIDLPSRVCEMDPSAASCERPGPGVGRAAGREPGIRERPSVIAAQTTPVARAAVVLGATT